MANNKIICTCGHSWDKSDSSKKDATICHICGKNIMKNGGWLDEFEYGGTMQEYQENYNDNTTSVPPGFVGMGNNTKGRNYSPAWGGQFKKGGEIPQAQLGNPTRGDSILVMNNAIAKNNFYKNNPDYHKYTKKEDLVNYKDPKVLQKLANLTEQEKKDITKFYKNNQLIDETNTDKKRYKVTAGDMKTRVGKVAGSSNVYSAPDIISADFIDSYYNPASPPVYFSPSILPQGSRSYASTEKSGAGDISTGPYYDPLAVTPWDMLKPIQQQERLKKYGVTGTPYANPKYKPPTPPKPKPERTLNPKKLDVQPIPLGDSTPQFSIDARPMPRLDIPPMQQGHYRVEYFDPSLGEETHRRFMSQAESDAFTKELGQRSMNGVPAAGNITQRYEQYAMGGSLPGSVGFTYARTKGIPSEGPYAKKTMPSAQDGDKYSKNKQQVVNQLSNLPIYSPDQRYSEYQSNIQDWMPNIMNTPVEVNYNSPAEGSSYYGHGAPSYDPTFSYQGTVQLDDRQFNNIQTPDRVIGHELRHAAFDGSRFIPKWYADNLYNTARNPKEFEQGTHQNKLKERASMLIGVRQNALDELGLPANAKIPEEGFNYWARQPLETALRTGRLPEQYNDIKETFEGARSANDVRNLINFENIPRQENGGMTYYQNGLDWKPKSISRDGSVIKDDNGYWNPDNWGKVVEIDSPDITMEDVYEPLIGESKQTGEKKLMLPGKKYKFANTEQVIERPIGKTGINQQNQKVDEQLDQLTNFTNYNKPTKGGWLDKYN